MTTGQVLADVLDETIRALAFLELDALEMMEKRLMVAAQSSLIADEASFGSILRKKRVLELALHQSESNLNALRRLHGRNTRDLWEH